MLQGACLFSLNFYFFYSATEHIVSGLSAVVMSVSPVFNSINLWLFFHQRPSVRVLTGSLLGMAGICTMFWPEISMAADPDETVTGILLATMGTTFFSLANMISIHHQRNGLTPPTTNAWGMLYGVIILTLIALLQGVPFTIDMHPQYLGSLFYLAIPGSVVAFTTYLLLVGRIGADRAAYSTVMFPAVALTVSTFFEGYQWTMMAVAGFVLVVAGNIIIFARRRNG
ncbi:DMT family transporter [Spongorhabdus nitratireducens]